MEARGKEHRASSLHASPCWICRKNRQICISIPSFHSSAYTLTDTPKVILLIRLAKAAVVGAHTSRRDTVQGQEQEQKQKQQQRQIAGTRGKIWLSFGKSRWRIPSFDAYQTAPSSSRQLPLTSTASPISPIGRACIRHPAQSVSHLASRPC